jgi:hypothetical protein
MYEHIYMGGSPQGLAAESTSFKYGMYYDRLVTLFLHINILPENIYINIYLHLGFVHEMIIGFEAVYIYVSIQIYENMYIFIHIYMYIYRICTRYDSWI